MSLITVAIPTFNHAILLREALESVFAQNYQDFQVVISDNSSTDETPAILSSYREPRVRIYHQERNIGMVENWKYVLNKVSTPLALLLHDDDLLHEDFLKTAVYFFKKDPDISFFSCAIQHFGINDNIQKPFGLNDIDQLILSPKKSIPIWLAGFPSQVSASVFKTANLKELDWGPAGLIYPLDYYILGQMILKGNWAYTSKTLAKYREHSQSGTSQNWSSGKRGLAQFFYVLRMLGSLALQKDYLDKDVFVREINNWPISNVERLLLAFLSSEATPELREFGVRILKESGILERDKHSSIPFKISAKLGSWYLSRHERILQFLSGWP